MSDEAAARAAHRGIWAGKAQPPWEWRTAQIKAVDAPGKCTIKGNINNEGERIYFMPFHSFYNRTKVDETKGERWFCTEAEAMAAGWRRALR